MNLYHVSWEVPDIRVAMEALSCDLGYSWRPLLEVPNSVVSNDGTQVEYMERIAYSVEGPPALVI
jgi:hypothetical protein